MQISPNLLSARVKCPKSLFRFNQKQRESTVNVCVWETFSVCFLTETCFSGSGRRCRFCECQHLQCRWGKANTQRFLCVCVFLTCQCVVHVSAGFGLKLLWIHPVSELSLFNALIFFPQSADCSQVDTIWGLMEKLGPHTHTRAHVISGYLVGLVSMVFWRSSCLLRRKRGENSVLVVSPVQNLSNHL